MNKKKESSDSFFFYCAVKEAHLKTQADLKSKLSSEIIFSRIICAIAKSLAGS